MLIMNCDIANISVIEPNVIICINIKLPLSELHTIFVHLPIIISLLFLKFI